MSTDRVGRQPYVYSPVFRDYSGFAAVPPVHTVDTVKGAKTRAPRLFDADSFEDVSSGPARPFRSLESELNASAQAQALSAVAGKGYDTRDVFIDNMR